MKWLVIAFSAVMSLAASLHLGALDIEFRDIFNYLRGGEVSREISIILGSLRIPRTLATFTVGGALGVSGLVLQSLLRNPLAEPYTLGLSGGSCLGALIALALELHPQFFWIPMGSTLGCLMAISIILGLSRKNLEVESRSLILFGVTISLFFGALVVTGLSLLSPEKLQTALFWLLGEFGTIRDAWIYWLGPVILVLVFFILWRNKTLDALLLGEARALSLGVSPGKARAAFILTTTLLTALSVSISGLVGFVGLVAPHISRRFLKTSRHRELILATFLIGASVMTLADTLGRILTRQQEIPAGSLAALIGAPLLIYLLMSEKHASVE